MKAESSALAKVVEERDEVKKRIDFYTKNGVGVDPYQLEQLAHYKVVGLQTFTND